MPSTGQGLANQYHRAWEMLRGVVGRIPEERWRADENPKLTPARWALHAVEAVDAYERDLPEDYQWGGRFCDWEGGRPDELPTRDELLGYLDEVAERLDARLRGMTDEEMRLEPPYPWTGSTNLERWLYGLRHTMHHTGELSMLVRLTGDEEEGEWR